MGQITSDMSVGNTNCQLGLIFQVDIPSDIVKKQLGKFESIYDDGDSY